MTDRKYQYDFAKDHADTAYDLETREAKASKILLVLKDYYQGEIEHLSLLDIGCSTGMITNLFSRNLNKVVGIDIDEKAIAYAKDNFQAANLSFELQDTILCDIESSSFDIVVCNHIYEHVSDCNQLMSTIHRTLKPGGVCYFSAGNRLKIIEGEYGLPFLSIIPKPLAHLYLRILQKGDFYYENHLTLWGLRKLVSRFEIIDYSLEVIENPEKYSITKILRSGSIKQKLASAVVKNAYWLCPTYIWLLKKNVEED